MVRLVKGAYWDTEIKRAQERGLADYPVFTRKAMTDLCYLACARQAAGGARRIYPQFATHNALTVATVLEEAGGVARLRVPAPARHGRSALRGAARRACPTRPAASTRRSAAIATCSPIWCAGCWRTAPTPPSSRSAADPRVPIADLLRRPQRRSPTARRARNASIPLPRELYGPDAAQLGRRRIRRPGQPRRAARRDPRRRRRAEHGAPARRRRRRCAVMSGAVVSPIDGTARRHGRRGGRARSCRAAMHAAARGLRGAGRRRRSPTAPPRLERAADLLERERGRLLALLQTRAARRSTTRSPKCARRSTSAATTPPRRAGAGAACALPGPTGESNTLRLSRPRRLRLHQPVELSRSRSSSARSRRRSPPATRSSPSPPSRRR